MSEQDDNLDRVSERITVAILDFYAWHVRESHFEFHAEEMRQWVFRVVGTVAPGSPDRVMRNLRKIGVLNYRVINRANSLYRIELEPPGTPLQFDSGGQSFFV